MKFNTNDRVVVSKQGLMTYNRVGTVVDAGWTGSYVRLDEIDKTLYYRNDNLRKTTEEEKEKDKMYITGDFKVAKVKFLSGTNTNTEYEYAMFDDYQIGTTVIVQSAHHGLGVAKIMDVIDKEKAVTKKFEREIVTAIDMTAYEQRKKDRARLKELDSTMKRKAEEINKLAVFEMLAEKDEELKNMLEEYKNLLRDNGERN